jgi:hypothetical protein
LENIKPGTVILFDATENSNYLLRILRAVLIIIIIEYYLPEFDGFGDAFFDVSVINSGADSYVRRASKGQSEGSEIIYEAKISKYPELGRRFKPLVVEATGGRHRYSFDYLKILAEHISTRTNKSSKSSVVAFRCLPR